jgi:hypothetical protein
VEFFFVLKREKIKLTNLLSQKERRLKLLEEDERREINVNLTEIKITIIINIL